MKSKRILILILLLGVLVSGAILFLSRKNTHQDAVFKKSLGMMLSSGAFTNNSKIPAKYTCDGENVSPPLEISEVPVNTKSIVLIVDDPDAPVGDWVHWLVWNISASVTVIEGALPEGAIQGKNDFGNNSYGGPCPPGGTHRYQFKLYALDTTLNLPEETRKGQLEKAMEGHVLDKATLTGLYR